MLAVADWYAGFTLVDGIIWAIILLALWVGYRWLGSLQYLLAATYHDVLFVPVASDQVAEHVRAGLNKPLAELEAQGFVLLRWVGVRRMLVGERALVYRALLRHQETGTHCLLGFSRFPEPLSPWDVLMRTWLQDGSSVITTTGGQHVAWDPQQKTCVQKAQTNCLKELWQIHSQALRQRSASAETAELDDEWAFLRAEEDETRAYLANMKQQGLLVTAARRDDRFVLSWRAAVLGTAKRVRLRRNWQTTERQHTKTYRRANRRLAEVPVEEEVDAFLDLEWVHGQPSRRLFYLGVFLTSFVIFAATALQLVPPYTVFLLCVVVGFHELGHWATMKILGYEDASIFFIPLLGAVTTGSKEDPAFFEEMLILLAGPLPGLVLAGGYMWTVGITDSRWVIEALFLLLTLNAANLLPLFPLDGGRIVQALLLAGRPYSDSAFRILAVVALWAWAVVCLVLDLPFIAGLTYVVGMAMAVHIPRGWRLARLHRRLLAEHPSRSGGGPERAILVSIFTVIRQMYAHSLSFMEKVQLARALEDRANTPRSHSRRVTVIWFCVYVVALGAGILLAACFVAHLPAPGSRAGF